METRNIRIKLSVENTWLNVNLNFKRSKQTAPLRTEANCMECLCGDHRKWPNDPSKPSNHHQWYIMRHAQPLVDAYRDVTSEGGANLTCPGAVPSRSAPPQAGSGHARQTATTCSNVNEMQGCKLAQKNPVRSYSETYAEFSGTSRFFIPIDSRFVCLFPSKLLFWKRHIWGGPIQVSITPKLVTESKLYQLQCIPNEFRHLLIYHFSKLFAGNTTQSRFENSERFLRFTASSKKPVRACTSDSNYSPKKLQ